MVQSSQLTPGMTISINDELYRVESAVKVTVPKGSPFIKAKLRQLSTGNIVERNFKPSQELDEATLNERKLEFLYPEGKNYLFLDVGSLEQVQVPSHVIGSKVSYLKEGIEVKAALYGGDIFSIELPQFLELMVTAITSGKSDSATATSAKIAQLETGAKVEVPPFVGVGDIVKVDTNLEEFIQRV